MSKSCETCIHGLVILTAKECNGCDVNEKYGHFEAIELKVSDTLSPESDEPEIPFGFDKILSPEEVVSVCKKCDGAGQVIKSGEWDGEGLPPVGKAVLCTWSTKQPALVIIDFISDTHSIFTIKSSSTQLHVMTKFCKFTPYKTPEQLAEEERKAKIKEIANILDAAYAKTHHHGKANLADAIYDAGYRIAHGEGNE